MHRFGQTLSIYIEYREKQIKPSTSKKEHFQYFVAENKKQNGCVFSSNITKAQTKREMESNSLVHRICQFHICARARERERESVAVLL